MNKILLPLDTARRMHDVAVAQHLDGAERLGDFELTRSICNGIGAEWFPAWARCLVCAIASAVVPTSWIHDLDYEAGGGWRERWIADWRFLCNGCRAAWYTYAWDQLRRYSTLIKVLYFWIMLRLFGAAAFNWRRGGE